MRGSSLFFQARSREINAEKYADIKGSYIATLADIEVLLDEMVSLFQAVM